MTRRQGATRVTLAMLAGLSVTSCSANRGATLPGPRACEAATGRTHVLLAEVGAEERARIDAQARLGTVVVHLDSCGLTVLPGCRATGTYAYHSRPEANESRRLTSAAELTRLLPLASERLAPVLRAAGSLRFDVAHVGELATSEGTPRFEGSCQDATHWVRTLGLGSFALSSSGDGGPAPRGASGSSTESASDQAGDLRACNAASTSDRQAPAGCDALVALDVVPIGREATAGGAPPSPFTATPAGGDVRCGPGMHYSDLGDCVANALKLESGPVIAIPAGTFFSGYPGQPIPYQPGMGISEGTFIDQRVDTRIELAAFELDVTEVTVEAYRSCVDAGRCTPPGTSDHCTYPDKSIYPVNCVDWSQARAYCAAVGKRLPTPHEWEYAARGSDNRAYPWGNELATPALSCVDHGRLDSLHISGVSVPTVAGACPVGAHTGDRSPFGILDLGGNVREWTAEQACVSSVSPCMEGAVVKGGCWGDLNIRGKFGMTVRKPAASFSLFAETRSPELGFRCAGPPIAPRPPPSVSRLPHAH